MAFASEESVNSMLRPHFGDMAELVKDAFADWQASPFAATMQDPKVRANVVWNQFLYRAKVRFEGHPDTTVETMRHWDGLVVGNDYFVRMKKGDSKLLSRNYPTQSALNFNDASVDLFEGVIRLELLYALNDLETEVERIVVAQRHRNKILWAIDLLDSGRSGQAVIPMPNPNSGGDSPAKRVLRPKDGVEKFNKKQGADGDTK